jgi:chemotaxis protein MotB
MNKRLANESKSLQGPQLDVQATEEGILISLTDRQNFSMFPIGSAEPQPRVLHMMEAIAASLQGLQGAIVVRGHTDGRPYRSATYDNWRLSSARAQMAYYMLIRGGLPEKRFERVEGYANHSLKEPSHPLAAENRRIEILVREAKP